MKAIILVLTLLFLSTHPVYAAGLFSKDMTPPDPTTNRIGSSIGIQILPGWNYLTLSETPCSLEILFNEMQADAGGGIFIGTLFTKPTENGIWKRYDYGKSNLLEVIPSEAILAYQSEKRFYFDMTPSACSEEPKQKRTMQIASSRAVAQTSEAAIKQTQDERDQKTRELSLALSPLGSFRFWLHSLWQAIGTFFQNMIFKKGIV
ncbi:hypothetical protein HY947_03665 [Candidatus Gottesmanbacteria bacterium]|nr:hypothetical protein [Candidatus Gottesmanbacteria bacterium]